VFSDATAAAFLADPADAPGWADGAKYGNGLARVTINDRAYLHHTGGMVSFCSSMHIDAQAGVAAFASSNVHYGMGYRPRGVTHLAWELFRAAKGGGPAPTPMPTRPIVENAERFAGVYTSATGVSFEIRAQSDRISMRCDGRDSDMQPVAATAFACSDPRFSLQGLFFDIEEDKVVRAWAHEVEFVRDPAKGYKPAPSPELQALAGNYVNDNRWGGNMTVVARDGGLWLYNAEPLARLPDGSWRVGADDWSPERVRFDNVVNSRPERMLLSGTPYLRRFS
jgi:hypothetical protein